MRPFPELTNPSAASEADIELYTEGFCHVFAVALHRRFGWRMVVILDEAEPYWQDEEDEDNVIPSVLHLYAVDSQDRAWDVRGWRQRDAVRTEVEEWLRPNGYAVDELNSEAELVTYVGFWADGGEPIDRPLPEFAESDIAEADEAITRILGQLPDLPDASPAP